jgi:VCBS repeat-containing protein
MGRRQGTLSVAALGVLANDTDRDGDRLTAALVTAPAHGRVTLASDGSFVYSMDAGWYGTDTFTYQASDGTLSSAPVSVLVNRWHQRHNLLS